MTGCPSSLRTLVVVPTLLTDQAEIEEQIERLEVHYLANPTAICASRSSPTGRTRPETMPGDDDLLAAAVEGIARLNRRHGPAPDGGAAISPVPPPPRLERKRAEVDRLGTQTREAA